MRGLAWTAVLAVVMATPFAGTAVAGVDVTMLLMAGAAGAGLMIAVLQGSLVRLPLVLVALALVVSSFVASTAASGMDAASVALTVRMALGWGLVLAVWCTARADRVLSLLRALAFMATAVAAWTLSGIGPMTSDVGGGVVTGRLQGPFAQPNELGMFCALTLPICLALVLTDRSRRWQLTAASGATLIAAAGVLSLSRGAWAGTMVALAVMWWLLPTARARLARAIGATIAVAAVTGAVLGTRLAAVLGERVTSLASAAHNPYDHRGELWAAGVRVALEHPWLGVGPGRFGVVASDGGHSLYRYVADHPHNLVLTVAAETGAYGLATTGLFALLLLATVAAQRRRCAIGGSGALPAALAGPAAGLAAVAVHGLVDVPLRNPIVESTVWLVLAALVVTTAPSPLPSSSFPSAARTRPHPTRRSA